jgi:hypothetical protein
LGTKLLAHYGCRERDGGERPDGRGSETNVACREAELATERIARQSARKARVKGSVYISRFHSTDGGTSWNLFGPSPWYGYGAFVFDPADPQTAYITNDAVGVQKTSDLLDPTPTWQDKVQGLTALSCTSMAVSPGLVGIDDTWSAFRLRPPQ